MVRDLYINKEGAGWTVQHPSPWAHCTHAVLLSGAPSPGREAYGVCSWSAAQGQTLQPGASAGGPVSTDAPAEVDPLPPVQLQGLLSVSPAGLPARSPL